METSPDLIQGFIDFIQLMSLKAGEMDGRMGFFLGLVTWFVVEQIIRRMAGVLRWAVIIGALAAGGYTLTKMLTYL
ncbi:MAG: hypothetical protein ACPGVN_01175 [Alphaproteobacteria bacterium]